LFKQKKNQVDLIEDDIEEDDQDDDFHDEIEEVQDEEQEDEKLLLKKDEVLINKQKKY
jgi:hypothetical protein